MHGVITQNIKIYVTTMMMMIKDIIMSACPGLVIEHDRICVLN